MESEEILDLFRNLKVWKKGDKRAPHKPLLLLYMLGRLQRGLTGQVSFEKVDKHLGRLLDEFGPPRKTQPIYPFWYLQNDGLWELSNIDQADDGPLGPCPTKSFVRSNDIKGRIPDQIQSIILSDAELLNRIVHFILESNFPITLHEDILQAVGLDTEAVCTELRVPDTKRTRDPRFRKKVLKAYEYSCAVCGYSIRLGNNLVGLEAAHIKWHQAGGPDEERNGLALCSLHHSLFDRGAFSLNEKRILLVSENAHGNESFKDHLLKYHGSRINYPQRSSYYPECEFTEWHISEVFRGRPREY